MSHAAGHILFDAQTLGDIGWAAGVSTSDPIEDIMRRTNDVDIPVFVHSEGFNAALCKLHSRANDPSRSATLYVSENIPPHLAKELLDADLPRLLRSVPTPPSFHWRDGQGQDHVVDFDAPPLTDADIKRCHDRLKAIVVDASAPG